MKLYRPVLIESAEQAEALPEGTLARHSQGAGMDHAHKLPAGSLTRSHWVSSMGVVSNAAMVGWTALVPIEAEEEWKTLHEGAWHLKAHEDDARRDANALGTRRRYTTDWEEA